MAINYEIFEDNAGGLYLCIMDGERCKRIYEGFDYNPAGILADAIRQLNDDPAAYEAWDGDLVKRLTDDGQDVTAQSLYDDGLGELVADGSGYISGSCGAAAKKALNINDEDD